MISTENCIILENRHISIALDKESVTVKSVINKYTGEEICVEPEVPFFAYLEDYNEKIIPPTGAKAEGERIRITFENGAELILKAECFDDYFTFEIDSELDRDIKLVRFVNINTTLTEENNPYVFNAIPMTWWTRAVAPGHRNPAPDVYASAYPYYKSVKGAKLGVVFAKYENALETMKTVLDKIDPKFGFVSHQAGPWAREFKPNSGDYALILDISPENIEESIKYSLEFGIEQYDIHQNSFSTFRQGDFRFMKTENGTAAEHRNGIGKMIDDAGLITALHNYAYYIAPTAAPILTNPKWQKQLRVKETYTLGVDVDKDTTFLPTLEDASGFDTQMSFLYTNMSYVLLDEEIIKVVKVDESGLIECVRGIGETSPTPHKKGAEVKKLDGVFGMFTPVIGSELFYHIADNIAKAYNEGGFNMIYFDAIDGIGRHLDTPEEKEWGYFYHLAFVHRVLSQCERTPIVETSHFNPIEWNYRARCGAWDYANFSIKKHIRNHARFNIQAIKSNMTATLGWFSFMPDEKHWGHTKNTNFKTLFHDDMDYLGLNAILYDFSIVYHPLDVKSIKENPFHYANIKYYTDRYSRLRKSNYFKPHVIEALKSAGGEWRVVERGNEYAFQNVYYEKANLGNILDADSLSYKAINPFKAQAPFIRIESRYSTLFEEPLTLAKFDNGKPTLENPLVTDTEFKNIDERQAKTIRIKGTGCDGDAALISLTSAISGGRVDHFIDLNFTGWREFLLLDMDNADYDTDKYVFSDVPTEFADYGTFRACPQFFQINKATIRLCGKTSNKAEFTALETFRTSSAPIKNPTVKVGSSSVVFYCEMRGSDYLEYDPETGKALLFHNVEQTVDEVEFSGVLETPQGEMTISYSAESLSSAPLRAKLVLGFIGEDVMN